MSLKVLKSSAQIAEARQELVRRGLSGVDSSVAGRLRRFLNERGVYRQLVLGDDYKSWDVLETLRFLEKAENPSAAVLDIGCFACEILPALHALGFRNLTGVDLDQRVGEMPFAGEISYLGENFLDTSFDAETFDAVTAISVIEHGFDGERLFREISRILKPGGFFLTSFDYWPEKINTDEIRMFNMDWRIFSKEEVTELLAVAAQHGVGPIGDLDFDADDRAIHHAGRAYTFAWLALQKLP